MEKKGFHNASDLFSDFDHSLLDDCSRDEGIDMLTEHLEDKVDCREKELVKENPINTSDLEALKKKHGENAYADYVRCFEKLFNEWVRIAGIPQNMLIQFIAERYYDAYMKKCR